MLLEIFLNWKTSEISFYSYFIFLICVLRHVEFCCQIRHAQYEYSYRQGIFGESSRHVVIVVSEVVFLIPNRLLGDD